ncbi:MAG: hypothetical protein HY056_03760 [Proteobacteria bacterium]|nr:hypothetical protein [Pseudomonadota bacterium]
MAVVAARGRSVAGMRRWFHRRDIRFIAVVASLLVAYWGYGYASGPSKLTGRLKDQLSGSDRVNIVVVTKFAPEAFHMGIYQDVGRIAGTDGNRALLYGVRPADVRALSRNYWISGIDLAPRAAR